MSKIGMNWSEELEPLGEPYSKEYISHWTGLIVGEPVWLIKDHMERLYGRCNSLLKRCEELEEVILNMQGIHHEF